jgi:hypothetical protein
MPTALRDVRSQGQSGKHMLALSFSGFDPGCVTTDIVCARVPPMRRRDVIVGLASIATAWPLAGRAEHALPLVGFLNGGSPTFTPYLIGLRQGLKDAGYIEGQNVLIEYRWAEGKYPLAGSGRRTLGP